MSIVTQGEKRSLGLCIPEIESITKVEVFHLNTIKENAY